MNNLAQFLHFFNKIYKKKFFDFGNGGEDESGRIKTTFDLKIEKSFRYILLKLHFFKF